MEGCVPEVDDMAAVDYCEPRDEAIAKSARGGEDDEESAARNAQRTGSKDKRGKRDGRREHRGNKYSEDGMMPHPADDAGTDASGHIAVESGFSTAVANEPCAVATQDAAGDGGEGVEPRIALMGDKEKQQQIGAAGDGHGDDG